MKVYWKNFKASVEEPRFATPLGRKFCEAIVQESLKLLKEGREGATVQDDLVDIEETGAQFEFLKLQSMLGIEAGEGRFLAKFSVPVAMLGENHFEYIEGFEMNTRVEWSNSFVSWPELVAPKVVSPHEFHGNMEALDITETPKYEVPPQWTKYLGQ